jgi:hypothetical protein
VDLQPVVNLVDYTRILRQLEEFLSRLLQGILLIDGTLGYADLLALPMERIGSFMYYGWRTEQVRTSGRKISRPAWGRGPNPQ